MAPFSSKARKNASDTLDKIAKDKYAWRDAWRVEEDKAGTTAEAGRISHITEHLHSEANTAGKMAESLRPIPLEGPPGLYRSKGNKKG